ncbi:MAG: hypothetical protein KJ043_16415, partial [Anaerolineae bacterium]|nr:hypothetical protein [Anaerolineae bacterium]
MTHTFGAHDKPLDFGYGGLSVSLTHTGRIMALNSYHPTHGYVTLTTAPPFPDNARYDPARVRAYRRELVKQHGFGVMLPSNVTNTQVRYDEHDNPILTMTLADGVTATCITHMESLKVFQDWEFSAPTTLFITGVVYLMRCPYPQLTEGGVLPPVGYETIPYVSDTEIGVINYQLDYGYDIHIGDTDLILSTDGSGRVAIHAQITSQTQFRMIITPISPPHDNQSVRRGMIYHAPTSPQISEIEFLPLLHNGEGGRGDEVLASIHTRAWRYARLCATPTEHDTLCILTDHIILPLSWNRDAYYTARLFLDHPQTHILTQKHLLWMFETAERLNGLWGRSYLANGKIKDKGYQLDQQLFPLLELAEYVQITGDTALLDRLRGYIQPIFTALASHRAPHALLYATDETPADDPIAQPYPLSSHILFWKVLVELEKIGCADMCPHTPNDMAGVIMTHFIGDHHGKSIFAYATDGHGGHHFYHDANDVPNVLMPVWKFCHTDDPVWR